MNSEKELLIEICKKCYLDCRFCSTDADEKSMNLLTLDLIKSIVKDAKRSRISKIQISGGEPFTHPDLVKICNYLSRNIEKILIYTSGNIKIDGQLSPLLYKTLKNLLKLKVNTLRFNLQSHKSKIHNFLSNSNSFNNAIFSLRTSIEMGFNTEIHLIPLKQNHIKLKQTIQFFKDLGISKIKFLRFIPHGRGLINRKSLELNQIQLNNLIKEFISLKKRYGDFIEIGSSFNNSLITNKYKFCRDCQLGKNKIAITPEGKVFPCVSTKNVKIFNFQLQKQSLYGILNSKEYLNKLNYYLSIPFKNIENKNNHNSYNDLCPTQRYLKIISSD